MCTICARLVYKVLREEQNERHVGKCKEMDELISFTLREMKCLLTWDKSWIYCYYSENRKERDRDRESAQWKHSG